jgi:hypothetical protein
MACTCFAASSQSTRTNEAANNKVTEVQSPSLAALHGFLLAYDL